MEDGANIVVVASCNVDLISYVERMPQIGETLMGKKFQSGFGGKGANKAIACSRLGSKCAVIAKLGNDAFGKDYLENFKKNDIRIDHVFISEYTATGVAPIIVDENGKNSIIVILGANLELSSEDIKCCEKMIKNSRILVTNLEIKFETALSSLRLAKTFNVKTVLNFAPAATNEFDVSIFKYTDYLVLNEVEAEQLSKLEIKSTEQAQAAGSALLNKYDIQVGVVITLGEKGVVYVDKVSRQAIVKSIPQVQVIDTTGAGDAFVGSFAHFLNLHGSEEIGKILGLATEYASLTVQSLGTQSSYPYLQSLPDKFK